MNFYNITLFESKRKKNLYISSSHKRYIDHVIYIPTLYAIAEKPTAYFMILSFF